MSIYSRRCGALSCSLIRGGNDCIQGGSVLTFGEIRIGDPYQLSVVGNNTNLLSEKGPVHTLGISIVTRYIGYTSLMLENLPLDGTIF